MTVMRSLVLSIVVVFCLTGTVATLPDTTKAPPEAADESVLDDTLVRFQAKRGLNLLYDMRFDEARGLFDQIAERHPEHPIGPFLQALTTWWTILLDLHDTSHDEAFFEAMDEVIDRSDALLDENSEHFDAKFFKGAALGFRGRLRSNRGNWWGAARDGRRAMSYVLSVAAEDSANHDFIFGKGLYDYFADVIPERYPYVRPAMVFFPDGDREEGLEALERTAEEGYYVQTEANYYLLQIYYLFERDYTKSLEYVRTLREMHPQNSFFHAYEGRVHARWGAWQRGAEVFAEVLERYDEGRPGYNDASAEQALYYIARAHTARREFDEALDHLVQLEALSSGRDEDSYFRVMGRLQQGMVYDAMGERDVAEERYHEVLSMEDHAGAHDRAERYLSNPYS